MIERPVSWSVRVITLNVPIATLIIAAVAAGVCGCGSSGPGPDPAPVTDGSSGLVPDTKPVPAVNWMDATVPQGTVLKLSIIDSLNSGSTRKGDDFRALVTDAVLVNGVVAIPSGSNVMGVVGDVVPASAGFHGKGGMLRLDFNRIGTPTGASAELKARLAGLTPSRTGAVAAGPSDPGAITAGARGREAMLEPNTPLTIALQEALRIKVKQ